MYLFPPTVHLHRLYIVLINSRGRMPSHTLGGKHAENTHISQISVFFLSVLCLQLCCCRPTLLPSSLSSSSSSLDLAHFPLSLIHRPTWPFLSSASPLMKSSINKHSEQGVRERERYGQVEHGREVEGWRDGQLTAVCAKLGQ